MKMGRRRKGTAGKEAGSQDSHPRVQSNQETCFFGTNATGGLECVDGHQNGFAKGRIHELVFF